MAIIHPTIPVLSFSSLSISFFTSPAINKKSGMAIITMTIIAHITAQTISNEFIRQSLKRQIIIVCRPYIKRAHNLFCWFIYQHEAWHIITAANAHLSIIEIIKFTFLHVL